jgi:hypothetical protein
MLAGKNSEVKELPVSSELEACVQKLRCDAGAQLLAGQKDLWQNNAPKIKKRAHMRKRD